MTVPTLGFQRERTNQNISIAADAAERLLVSSREQKPSYLSLTRDQFHLSLKRQLNVLVERDVQALRFGCALQRLRKARRLNRKQIAANVPGWTEAYLQQVERGNYKVIPEDLTLLADALGLSEMQLLNATKCRQSFWNWLGR